MQVSVDLKVTHNSSSASSNKQSFNTDLDNTFEETLEENLEEKEDEISHSNQASIRNKTLKEQEKRCSEITRNIKYKDKRFIKVEQYLSKKLLEERRRIRVMIQVLNDISKNFPYFLFHVDINKKRKIIT